MTAPAGRGRSRCPGPGASTGSDGWRPGQSCGQAVRAQAWGPGPRPCPGPQGLEAPSQPTPHTHTLSGPSSEKPLPQAHRSLCVHFRRREETSRYAWPWRWCRADRCAHRHPGPPRASEAAETHTAVPVRLSQCLNTDASTPGPACQLGPGTLADLLPSPCSPHDPPARKLRRCMEAPGESRGRRRWPALPRGQSWLRGGRLPQAGGSGLQIAPSPVDEGLARCCCTGAGTSTRGPAGRPGPQLTSPGGGCHLRHLHSRLQLRHALASAAVRPSRDVRGPGRPPRCCCSPCKGSQHPQFNGPAVASPGRVGGNTGVGPRLPEPATPISRVPLGKARPEQAGPPAVIGPTQCMVGAGPPRPGHRSVARWPSSTQRRCVWRAKEGRLTGEPRPRAPSRSSAWPARPGGEAQASRSPGRALASQPEQPQQQLQCRGLPLKLSTSGAGEASAGGPGRRAGRAPQRAQALEVRSRRESWLSWVPPGAKAGLQ